MTANTSPIYSKVGNIQWSGFMTTANNVYDGTGTVGTVFTADATNGRFLRRIKCKPNRTNVATVARFFINNGRTNRTARNNVLYAEFSLPAITARASRAQPEIEIPMNLALPPGYVILVILGTTVAGGWNFCGVGGTY